MKTTSTDQKKNTALYRRMEETYGRYQASKLSRKAFCKAEGLSLAQFTYWCQRFEKKLSLHSTAEKTIQDSPISSSAGVAFTQITLPDEATLPAGESEPLAASVSESSPTPATPSVRERITTSVSPVPVTDYHFRVSCSSNGIRCCGKSQAGVLHSSGS